MNSRVGSSSQSSTGSSVTPLLRAVLLADLVDSTAFVQQFGDARAAVALQRLDLQIRDLLEFSGGRLIDKADGLLALFERPIQAVDFALRYQQALRHFSAGEGVVLTARVGIHVGELMTWSNTDSAIAAGAKPLEVEGLAKPVAARLMSLALPGQILMSSMAQALAHRAQAELGERAERIRWVGHGRYRFKGVPAPLLVHEVGELGYAPLRQPPSGPKIWRELPIWRRPPVLAVQVLLLIGLLGFYGFSVLRSPPALAFQARDWVVIGDINNFTGDPRLEDSLETALRIGLEQSRFVNVLPDLKVRSSLERMGRDEQTPVDRAIGSEIAIREGARALLLPSVSEVGGKLRVSVEVVDPNSQSTVYSPTEEGRGIGSVLASMDAVNREMRGQLGEALADIRASKPLLQVTTSDLNALRAYTVGQQHAASGGLPNAIALQEEAIKLDPEFALAYVALARLRLHSGDEKGYYQTLRKAATLRSRLSHREALMLDASIAMHDPVEQSLGKWRLLTELYPDEFYGHYNYGLASWYHSYDLGAAVDVLRPATEARNPRRRSAFYLQGVLYLTQERFTDSLASFRQFESLGGQGYNQQHAQAFAAQRRFSEARSLMARKSSTGVGNVDFPTRIDSVIFELDEGRWKSGMSTMAAITPLAWQVTPDTGRRTELMQLSLRAFAADAKLGDDLTEYLTRSQGLLDNPNLVIRLADTFWTLVAGVLATEQGDAEAGRQALASARRQAAASGYPSIHNAAAMLEAALLSHDGKPEQAIARLLPLHEGNELYLSHAVLMRAYAAAGRFEEAVAEADWLASHRGLAYGEFNIDLTMNAANVVQSNLALLSAAEYSQAAGQAQQARQRLAQFHAVWPQARKLEFLRARLDKLDASLGVSPPRST